MAVAAFLVPVALFILLPYWSGLDGGSGPIVLSNVRLGRSFAVELGLSLLLGTWLWRLGWRPYEMTTLPFKRWDLLRGLGLWVALIVGFIAWAQVCRWVFPNIFAVAIRTQWAGRPTLGVVVPFVLFNALFEEILWLGLGLAAFRRFGLGVAAGVSAGLRVLVHAYQGPLALITIVPMSLIFTAYYIRSRRLGPVVVAHAFQDLLALGALALGMSGRGAV